MIIYLLRHAIAEPRGEKEYPRDDRPLTARGIEKMKMNAAGIDALRLGIDAVLHSPLTRSKDTARIVRRATGLSCPLTVTDALLPGADPPEILRSLAGMGPDDSVLLV